MQKEVFGVLDKSKLNLSQQCTFAARRANRTRGCIRPSSASQSKEGTVPLCSALMQPYLEHYMQFWASQDKSDMKLLDKFPKEGYEDGEEDKMY